MSPRGDSVYRQPEPAPVGAQSVGMEVPLRQWFVLLACSLNSVLNAFICMNFSVVSTLSRHMLRVDGAAVAWFYTSMLLTVFAGMPIGLFLVLRCEALAVTLSVLLNAGSAWLRWWGMPRHRYDACLLSALLNGAGAWAILPLPAQLSQQRFPPRRWVLTTSLVVQANYFGWMLGCLLEPFLVVDEEGMERFLAWQAAVALLIVLAFAALYRPAPKKESAETSDSSSFLESESSGSAIAAALDAAEVGCIGHERSANGVGEGAAAVRSCLTSDLAGFLLVMRSYPSFLIQVVAYGILGGVGFAVPSCNDVILESLGLHAKTRAVVNGAFIGTGVATGLLLGTCCQKRSSWGKVLKFLFVVCSLALTGLALLSLDSRWQGPFGGDLRLLPILVLEMVAGASSLGFLGIGIEAAATYPVGGTYVCFIIELLVQLVGAVLNQVSSEPGGFVVMACAAWLATGLLLVGFRRFHTDSDSFPERGEPGSVGA